jgi:hypothetical protein
MKISVYTRKSMSGWYPSLLQKVLIELGHSSALVGRFSNTAVDDDITFFVTFGYAMGRELRYFKGKTKCMVLVEVEQLMPGLRYWNRFRDDEQYVDVIVFPFSKQMDISSVTTKPALNMPLGYHSSLQYIASPMPHRNIFLLEGPRKLRIPYLNAVKDAGFSAYDDLYIFDLQEIANRVASVDICLTTHAYGQGSFLSTFRVVGLFMYNHGFVMSQRAHEPFLEENKHIVYFDSVDEMVEKCRCYIANQVEARKIAEEAYNHLRTLPMVEVVKSTVDEICKLKGW